MPGRRYSQRELWEMTIINGGGGEFVAARFLRDQVAARQIEAGVKAHPKSRQYVYQIEVAPSEYNTGWVVRVRVVNPNVHAPDVLMVFRALQEIVKPEHIIDGYQEP
jgi:hypothetical protein